MVHNAIDNTGNSVAHATCSSAMQVHWVSAAGVERHAVADLPVLIAREDGFVWVDLPAWDEQATAVLVDVFGCHLLAIQDCRQRNHVPKVHAYANHLFVILHAPELGAAGHVHLLELDQFIGRRYLITVHGPLGVGVPLAAALRETEAVRQRLASGRSRLNNPAEVSYSIVSALTRHMEAGVAALASKVATLERQVMQGAIDDSEQLIEGMFQLRHELLTIRTIAAHSREVYARMTTLALRFMPPEEQPFIADLMDQFDRVRSMCDGEMAFLQGVIDFYQTRTMTKLNIAMERLALITALLLPVTAVASLYGMNIIVFEHTSVSQIAGVLAGIGLIMVVMSRWAKRKGWW